MLVTTDTGHKQDAVVYGVGSRDVFLPLFVFSGVLNLDVDSSVRQKPCILSKDKSVIIELNLDSDLATVNGKDIILPHEVYEYKGMVMIPVKAISSNFGYTVTDTYNSIHISKN